MYQVYIDKPSFYDPEMIGEFKKLYKGAELFFIAGADSIMNMHSWVRPEEIFSLCEVIAIDRDEQVEDHELESAIKNLKEKYTLLGIEESVYYRTMLDLKCKLLECMECEKVPGTFVTGWFEGFFRLTRVSYGRFEYEVSTYTSDEPYTMKCGKVIKKGDRYIGFHIPSSGVPLTDEVRLNSYKEAYKRVSKFFDDGIVIFGCGSWLLYPKHREFLPERLNIRRFMDDFELVEWSEDKNGFYDIWRIFGRDAKLPYDKLPKDTTLKKAYAEWLSAGNKGGRGVGLFMFDGEKIV